MTGHRFVQAPFTPQQVASINAFQASEVLHPFTCPCDDHEPHVALRASTEALRCQSPGCLYSQNWVHGFMADGSWEKVADWREDHRGPLVIDIVRTL